MRLPVLSDGHSTSTATIQICRDIERGEEVTFSYLNKDHLRLALKGRRAQLMRRWGFECKCSRCIHEETK